MLIKCIAWVTIGIVKETKNENCVCTETHENKRKITHKLPLRKNSSSNTTASEPKQRKKIQYLFSHRHPQYGGNERREHIKYKHQIYTQKHTHIEMILYMKHTDKTRPSRILYVVAIFRGDYYCYVHIILYIRIYIVWATCIRMYISMSNRYYI